MPLFQSFIHSLCASIYYIPIPSLISINNKDETDEVLSPTDIQNYLSGLEAFVTLWYSLSCWQNIVHLWSMY